MFVIDSQGQYRTAYQCGYGGVKFCSECRKKLEDGEYYTRFTPYHPITGKHGQMLVRCSRCLPFRTMSEDERIERLDTAVWGNPAAHAQSTGPMQPVAWERDLRKAQGEYTTRERGTEPRMKRVLRSLGVLH